MLARFWEWYQRNYAGTLLVTTGIFLLQIFHLYWLFTAVVLKNLLGQSYFVFPESLLFVYVLADYFEIPALISTSILYLYDIRRGVTVRSLIYLALLNSQWAHILWITDEVVLKTFNQSEFLQWNAAIAWIAILIDYLEVPVIIDTLRKVYQERHLFLGGTRGEAPAGDIPS